MTKAELFAAVHEYASQAFDGYSVASDFNGEPDEQTKLLKAVRKFADVDGHALAERNAALSAVVTDLEAQLAVYDKLVLGLKMLQAKAAVCDAYLKALGSRYDNDLRRELDAAINALRAIQANEQGR